MASADTFIDFYNLLEIPCTASINEIKKAYRKIALKKHPDRNPDNPNAGAEFALLVEAKEILFNIISRNKYDIEYKNYQKKLLFHKKQKVKDAQREKDRKIGIKKLENAENNLLNKKYFQSSQNILKKVKKDSVNEELEIFRRIIREQENIKKFQKKELKKEQTKNIKSANKSLIIKWNINKLKNKNGYNKNELKTIFKVYGKINEINMISSKNSAQIIFKKNKYLLKAINDENILKNDFYLTLIINNKIKEKYKKNISINNKQQIFKNIIKQRQNLTHKQYETFVWNKVQKFIKSMNNNQIDSDNDVQIIDID